MTPTKQLKKNYMFVFTRERIFASTSWTSSSGSWAITDAVGRGEFDCEASGVVASITERYWYKKE